MKGCLINVLIWTFIGGLLGIISAVGDIDVNLTGVNQMAWFVLWCGVTAAVHVFFLEVMKLTFSRRFGKEEPSKRSVRKFLESGGLNVIFAIIALIYLALTTAPSTLLVPFVLTGLAVSTDTFLNKRMVLMK